MKKVLLAFALLPALFQAAQAGPREDSFAGITRCGQQSDDRAWLDCVYGAVQPMRAKLGLPPAPASQQRLVSGAVAPTMPRPAPIAPVRPSDARWVPLQAYNFDSRGMFTVTLADGTVWRQDQADVNYAHWKDPAPRYLVAVAGGAFGAATLQVRNDGNEYSVRRIR